MALVFDKINRVIIIESPQTEITIQDLINAIRDWEDEFEAIDISSLANAYGKQDLGGGTKVGITLELLNNWRVQFEDRDGPEYESCRIYGGNLTAINDYDDNPVKSSAFTQITIAQSSSPTLIEAEGSPLTEEEHNHLIQKVALQNTVLEINAKSTHIKRDADETKRHTTFIHEIEAGRWKIKNNQMIFYASDNKTEIAKFNLYDKDGNPTEINPVERRRV